jgi:hypothetical protein
VLDDAVAWMDEQNPHGWSSSAHATGGRGCYPEIRGTVRSSSWTCHAAQLLHTARIIQLRRDGFPELPWPDGRDLFQLLWCPRVHFFGNHPPLGGQSSGAKVFWRTEVSIRNPLAVWERSDQQLLYECALNPEEILEYSPACEFGPEMDAWLEHSRSGRGDCRGDGARPESNIFSTTIGLLIMWKPGRNICVLIGERNGSHSWRSDHGKEGRRCGCSRMFC